MSLLCKDCLLNPRKRHRTLCAQCFGKRHCSPAQEKARRTKLKLLCFQIYGGPKCACCGEVVIEFLQIDHIGNDGARHRQEIFGTKRASGDRFYKWLRANKFPTGFQVLCANCNFAKGHFGECPHVAAQREAAVFTS